ncbi:hypothetical protein BC826DRAFT_1176027 [Russula brevipes]|nr:hypothetical protein BC826DRAFT_1176027 [Russula brevipes]
MHVCRRWRYLVLASPRHIGLRIVCTEKTPAREMLQVYPALPIAIYQRSTEWIKGGTDNILAALNHQDRACEIDLNVPRRLWERFAAALRVPVPELTFLHLKLYFLGDGPAPALSDSFLGGYAPRLQTLRLKRITSLALGKLLSSASNLVELSLWDIPNSLYLSPAEMFSTLSSLTRLEILNLGFESPEAHTVQTSQRLPPPTRIVFPFLTRFQFQGIGEYLGYLAARIDAPSLDELHILLFHWPFSSISLTQFTAWETFFKALNRAAISFNDDDVHISLRPKTWPSDLFNFRPLLVFDITLRDRDVPLSSLAQVCSSSVLPLSGVEILSICDLRMRRGHEWSYLTDNTKWLEIFNTFTAVKKLWVCHTLGPRVASTLQELAPERVTDILPALEDLYFHEWDETRYPVEGTIGRFVTNRQLAGHPVSFHATFGNSGDVILVDD